MGYSDVFGGQLLFPSQLSYLAITTAVDVELQWPREQQIGGTDVVADFIDATTTVAALNITMPSASATSTGNKTTFNNVGGESFTVRDNDGGVIQQVDPGTQWVLILTDNTTTAGLWSSYQLGAATTFASAAALAGAGLQADGFGLLEQIIDSDVEAATPVTVVDGDRARCLIYTAGAGTADLPSPGTVGNNWFFMIRNSGSGTLTVDPGGPDIDGGASLSLDPNDSCFIFTDGSEWYTVGLSAGSTIAFDFVSIAVPGSGDFVLSGANLNRISYRFTGALTGNRRIVVPNTTQQYWVDNQTSGAFTLEVDTAAGAGQTVPQGESAILYCDATDVINAVSSTSVTFPITVGQGGTGATNATDARTNLNAAFDGRLIIAGDGMAGGGDLTADRTLDFDLNSITGAAPATGDFIVFEDIDNANVNRKATISDLLALGVALPSGSQNDTIYISTAPNTYSATSALSVDPAGAITLDHNTQQVFTTEVDGFAGIQGGTTDAQMRLYNTNNGGVMVFVEGTDGSAAIYQLSSAGGTEDLWVTFARNAEVGLRHNGTEMLRTATQANGSVEVNTNLDGYLPVATIEEGTFVADFSGDFSGTVQRTCEYVIHKNGLLGSIVSIFLPGVSGTSTSTQFASGAADIPGGIRPAGGNTVNVLGYVVDNSGARQIGRLTINGGQFEFFLGNEVVFNSWTGAGTKSCDDVNFSYAIE